MPNTIPFPTKGKETLPDPTTFFPDVPEGSEIKEADLTETPQLTTKPKESALKEETPEQSPFEQEIPEASPPKQEMPTTLDPENTVVINGVPIEIKPTKLKYFRNKTTASYGYIKAIPLTEFLTIGKNVFDKTKDADQLLFDFLVAVFDDPQFVTENYDEMTADEIDQIVKIFGRINHIDEKEEAARKNKEAQAKH